MATLFMAQGLERDRMLAAVAYHLPNQVVIIRNKRDISAELSRKVEKNLSAVKKKSSQFPVNISWNEVWVDFFSPVNALVDLYEQISSAEDARIDISSGNKLITIVLFLIASDLGLKVTYSTASSYKGIPGYGRLMEIPKIPVDLGLDIRFLKVLRRRDRWDSLTELAKRAFGRSDKSAIMSVARKLEPLEELGLVDIRRKGRRKFVEVTRV